MKARVREGDLKTEAEFREREILEMLTCRLEEKVPGFRQPLEAGKIKKQILLYNLEMN